MFKLSENSFVLKGICVYRDEWGNKITCTRASDGFVARLEFANKDIIAEPEHVIVAADQIEGEYEGSVKLSYNNGATLKGADAQAALYGYGEIVGYWSSMLGDLLFSELTMDEWKKLRPDLEITEKKLAEIKYKSLIRYEELKQSIESLKGINDIEHRL